ncbi:MAG: YkvA family protein [Elusimicrobia bacterium]|nr:YkvA family protein [Elusimicrobiota bacterium]
MLKDKIKTLQDITRWFKQELKVYQRVMKDTRTPKSARVLLWIAVGYALMPFDLIPDWIPVLGHLDDAIIVPVLVLIAVKRIPRAVIDDARKAVMDAQNA